MSNELINPNWHVVLIHFPIALLTLGLLIEVITLLSPKGSLRAAGRWMIALGAFATLPVMASGMFAFADQATGGLPAMGAWHESVQDSSWRPQQWDLISDHIWLTSIASLIAILTVMAWIASSDARRRKMYWFCLAGLIAAVVLIGLGANRGGEAVFSWETAVAHQGPPPARARDLDYYAPPLQVHVILAGAMVACILAGIALMLRKWNSAVPERPDRPRDPRARVGDALAEDPARGRSVRDGPGAPGASCSAKVYPGWFFIAAALLALLTAFFGYWSFNEGNAFTSKTLSDNIHTLGKPDHHRVLLHVIAGGCLVILPLLLAMFVRWMRRGRVIPLLTAGLLVVVAGLQMWWGIAILYDGHEGPLFGFNPAPMMHSKQVPNPASASPSAPVQPIVAPTAPATAPATRSAILHTASSMPATQP